MLMKAVKWASEGFMNYIMSTVASAVTLDQNSLSQQYDLARWIVSVWI